jgi:endonuclease/exonuclease/phosphatase family metal-dependent hydrolase
MLAYPAMRFIRFMPLCFLCLVSTSCGRSGSPFSAPVPPDGQKKNNTAATTGGDTTGAATSGGAATGSDTTGGAATGSDTTGGDTAESTTTGGDTAGTDTTTGGGTTTDGGDTTGGPTGVAGTLSIGTWNLKKFSKYGDGEFRLDDVAAAIQAMDIPVLALQELEVKDGTTGEGAQAFDALVDRMDGWAGEHVDWTGQDTKVGLIYDTKRATLNAWEVIYKSESWAFPRRPLVADLTVDVGDRKVEISVISIHLKAFKGQENVERRREACEKLKTYMETRPERAFVVIGDFNDDPYDPPDENTFTGTFLDAAPGYHLVSQQLPLGTVTSTGYGTSVNGDWQDGEFLDHAIIDDTMSDLATKVSVQVVGQPPGEWDEWKKNHSDHFPLLLHMEIPEE